MTHKLLLIFSGPSCPGLDLHFWRKVCRSCHCSKDVHDVQDDDLSGWAQFELLGTAKPKISMCKFLYLFLHDSANLNGILLVFHNDKSYKKT